MWHAKSDARLFAAVLVGLVAAAWVALLVWGTSPYSPFLGHQELGETRLRLDSEYALTAVLFVAGWSLMTIAMMLPTSLPLVILFRTITQRRPNRSTLTVILLIGYLGVWMTFGALAHFGDFWIHQIVESDGRLHANTWLLGAAPLIVAGA